MARLFVTVASFVAACATVNAFQVPRMSLDKYRSELAETAKKIAAPGKGILAVDESTKTIGKRLEGISVENTEANRQAYRGLLFTTPNIGNYISGAILYEETLFQNNVDGTPFVKNLNTAGVIPGIKVDMGLSPLPGGHPVETWCTGLDGLVERAQKYYAQGARFAKWRAVLQITSDGAPSELSIQENAWGLARYARAVQEGGLVPIVEPEILMDGDHNIETTARVQERVLAAVYKALSDNGVYLEGSLLKPSMTLPGADCGETVTSEKIAEYTVRTLERHVPSSVPGVMFLSGGMSEEEASINLNALNKRARKGPWSLSFSYGRALQQSCLKAWQGKQENVPAARAALLARAQANSEANLGKYVAGSQPSADETLFVKGYKY
ncbi:fructose-bisphosphate aldolase [Nannochloropsis oceanica]